MPAGAVPKDGPSAGVTMTIALVSLLTGRTVRHDVGMTGEATLRGRVLPVGGIKEKVLAARRHGIREVILPARNAKSVKEDLSDELRAEMTIHLVTTIDEVIALVMPDVAPRPASARLDDAPRESTPVTRPMPVLVVGPTTTT